MLQWRAQHVSSGSAYQGRHVPALPKCHWERECNYSHLAWWWWTQHDPAVHFNLLPLCWLVFEAKAIGSSQNPGPQLSPTLPQRLQATYNDSSMGDLQVRPELGNVAFGSGLHGWGFSIETFAKILSAKSGMAPWPAPFVAPRWHWMWQKYAKVPR